MSNGKFVYVIYIATTPQKVWKALLEGELTRQYWRHENVSDWKPGSKWELVADDGNARLGTSARCWNASPISAWC